MPADDQMKHVKLEQFPLPCSNVLNDNPLQCVCVLVNTEFSAM